MRRILTDIFVFLVVLGAVITFLWRPWPPRSDGDDAPLIDSLRAMADSASAARSVADSALARADRVARENEAMRDRRSTTDILHHEIRGTRSADVDGLHDGLLAVPGDTTP